MPHQTPAQYGLPICLAIIVTIPILFAIMALLVSLAQKYGSRITTVFRICLTVVLVHLAQGAIIASAAGSTFYASTSCTFEIYPFRNELLALLYTSVLGSALRLGLLTIMMAGLYAVDRAVYGYDMKPYTELAIVELTWNVLNKLSCYIRAFSWVITSYTATKAPGPKNAMDDGSDKDAGIDSLAEETDSNEPIMIPSGPGIEHFEGWN